MLYVAATRGVQLAKLGFALELLKTAVLAQKPFEEIVEPIARSFDESGRSEEELDDLVKQTQTAVREEKRQNKIGDARTYSPRRL